MKTELLSGRRILLVEDEYFLADEIRRKPEDLGAIVVGPTGNVGRALDLIDQERIDAAILDIHLGDELVFAVADELESRNINFVFATGYNLSDLPVRYRGVALYEKPPELEMIASALFGPRVNVHLPD
ncbi:response regulator [Rhizobium hidalgonense]|uniref:response regulator n=1 Tax=Rhizobium hidalgonense TaxID=1538159 RepID=UPI002871F3F9|nr:response regulator [Rhizobium hidalgonense]MDR9805712.1 response regulator [Rhizobium hidalgonense]